MHPILTAAGIELLPPGVTEASVVEKIISDRLVYDRVLRAVVEHYGAQVIETFHQMEKEHVRKKAGVVVVKPPTVTFEVVQGVSDGLWSIRATIEKRIGGLSSTGGDYSEARIESAWYSADPRKAHEFSFYNSRPPAAVVAEYARVSNWAAPPRPMHIQGEPGIPSVDAFPDFDPNAADKRRRENLKK